MNHIDLTKPQKSYMLNDLIGAKVLLHGKKIGWLRDIIARENGPLPKVTHIYVGRLFGNPSLLIPWDKIRSLTRNEVVVDMTDLKQYERDPEPQSIQLKEQILDKKILDTEDRDVDVVYDIRLILINNQLLVSDVDTSSTGLLRRIGLRWLSDRLNRRARKNKLFSWKYVQPLPTPLGRFMGDVKLKILKERLEDLHPADLADVLEELDRRQRTAVFKELDTQRASAALEEIDPKSQRELIASLKKEKIGQLIHHMTAGQAADLLSALPYSEVRLILQLLSEHQAKKIRAILTKQEENIVNFSTTSFIQCSPTMTVDEARNQYYQLAKDKKIVMYIYVVDEHQKLVGVIDLKELLQRRAHKLLGGIAVRTIISLSPKSSLREALGLFERYDYRAIPILDDSGKIVGVVPYRDIRRLKHRFLE